MRILIFIAFILGIANASAIEPWKNRLYCYGTVFSGNDFTVEIEQSHDSAGLVRNVYFAKNVDSGEVFVTDKCEVKNETLLCESDKIKVKVDIETQYRHSGLWDAAGYSYYEAQVTKIGLFSDKTENIRCR